MTIKEGFNSKPLTIRISHYREQVIPQRSAEVWIEQEGIEDESNPKRRSETLSYATLEEIIALRDECNEVIKSMAGV